jgi:hypothetical protein
MRAVFWSLTYGIVAKRSKTLIPVRPAIVAAPQDRQEARPPPKNLSRNLRKLRGEPIKTKSRYGKTIATLEMGPLRNDTPPFGSHIL